MGREHHRELRCLPGCTMEKREPNDEGSWRHRPMTMGMMFHPIRHPFMFPALCILIVLTVMLLMNILLTILVSLDMAGRKQFNGLWIPILLIVGIPGTALYALFRIGDNIMAKEQRT
jgi:hypothetical protein